MLGISAEAATGLTEATAETRVPVWAENWPAVRLFCAMGTQWRRSGC